jgi:hypothetical protein
MLKTSRISFQMPSDKNEKLNFSNRQKVPSKVTLCTKAQIIGSVKFYKPVAAENIFSDRVCTGNKVSVTGKTEV